MDDVQFAHQRFEAPTWEQLLKGFILNHPVSENKIWHKDRHLKKIDKELSVLGYYVKYRYGDGENVHFKLNETEGKVDGWVFINDKLHESVQIAIAWYEREEATFDEKLQAGEDPIKCDWVNDRMELLKNRCLERIKKKSRPSMGYVEIDTLLIGVRDCFVKRVKKGCNDKKDALIRSVEGIVLGACFKEVVIVDADYVGNGDVIIIPNYQ